MTNHMQLSLFVHVYIITLHWLNSKQLRLQHAYAMLQGIFRTKHFTVPAAAVVVVVVTVSDIKV